MPPARRHPCACETYALLLEQHRYPGCICRGRAWPKTRASTGAEILALTAEIVAAHVGNNVVADADLGGLIQSVFDTLRGLATDEPAVSVELTPAVPIRRSVTDDHIFCLEDGKKLKMLKRHLMTEHGLTPDAYREKWPQVRLPDGGSGLLRPTADARQAVRPRPKAGTRAGAGPGEAKGPAQGSYLSVVRTRASVKAAS